MMQRLAELSVICTFRINEEYWSFKMYLRWILGIFNVQIQSEQGHKFM